MHQGMYQRLREAAKAKAVLSYSDIAPLGGLDMDRQDHRTRIGTFLDEISAFEHEAGRPLLSAVVVQSGEGVPGKGFFKMAKQLGVMGPSEDSTAFFARELTRVYDAWAQ